MTTAEDKIAQKYLEDQIQIEKNSKIFRHIVERNHDDWKYSIEISTGPADNRINLKARGDNLKEVLADIATQKKELGVE